MPNELKAPELHVGPTPGSEIGEHQGTEGLRRSTINFQW